MYMYIVIENIYVCTVSGIINLLEFMDKCIIEIIEIIGRFVRQNLSKCGECRGKGRWEAER